MNENDIYNDGTLTIASGMTSIDGGINGAGVLDIQSGATLNMNYAVIEQGSINIDGTLMASLRNANDTVDIVGTLSGTGNVLLSAGAVGTYDVSLFTDANLNVDFGKTYQTTIEIFQILAGLFKFLAFLACLNILFYCSLRRLLTALLVAVAVFVITATGKYACKYHHCRK